MDTTYSYKELCNTVPQDDDQKHMITPMIIIVHTQQNDCQKRNIHQQFRIEKAIFVVVVLSINNKVLAAAAAAVAFVVIDPAKT